MSDQAPEPVAWIPEYVLDYLLEAGFCHAELFTVKRPGREPLYLAPPNAEQIRAEERERCAYLCDRFAEREMHPAECAAAIRSLA